MYPICLNLKEQEVIIIGGGRVAYRKAIKLLKEKAKITVISPCFIEAFDKLEKQLTLQQAYYEKNMIENSFLVIAATNDRQINEEIGIECRGKGKLCNIVDNPSLSTFMLPASFERGDLSISVSTNGKNPTLAQKIRNELETFFPSDYGEYVEWLSKKREGIIAIEKEEKCKKKRLKDLVRVQYSDWKKGS